MNVDDCGQGSNPNFSASFRFEVLSPASDRVSAKQQKSMEYVPDCRLRVSTAEMVDQLFLSTNRVANYLYLMVVDEQMSNTRGFSQLSSSCFAPPPPCFKSDYLGFPGITG